uniref:Odorant receptor n=1 Tax=Aulacocentrum confusum TaxID=2767324 RepID=A0A7G8Z926_9HYME|nr:olfactory receptor 7 [Aulacocentrum confusum]
MRIRNDPQSLSFVLTKLLVNIKIRFIMSRTIEAEFQKAKTLIEQVSKLLRLTGIWPDYLLSSNIRYALAILYYITFIFMEYCDLIDVFGNLDLMILNLMESICHTIIITRVLMMKFSEKILKVITDINEGVDDFYTTIEEKQIYIEYYLKGASFYNISVRYGFITATAWYITPLTNYVVALMANETAILVIPYRISTFFDISLTLQRTIIVYIYEIGIIYFSVCYILSCNIVSVAVNNVCCRLAVLSRRIKQLKYENNEAFITASFHYFCTDHLKIIRVVETINTAFSLVFLNELILITALISVIIYTIILNFDDVDIVGLISLLVYAVIMISLIGLNCVISQNLINQSTELRDTYWQCDWLNMPISCKKSLGIFMIFSQNPLQLSAGKFYIYSMPNFVNILKSSMAYVSMLRTVNSK